MCKPSATIVCFGVPDDQTYAFTYLKFFRANLTMIASVTPDPGVDFPEAVQVMESGSFGSVAPLYTHVLRLEEAQQAFQMMADCSDGVIKMIFDIPGPADT